MEHARTRKPSFGKSKGASPVSRLFLTTPTECYPLEAKHPFPEQA